MTINVERLRRLRAVWESAIERDLRLDTRMTLDAVSEARAVYLRELADAAPALLDRLERAERAPAVSREAGEVVEAVMDEMEICMERMPEGWIDAPARIVQRALDAAHESGAEAEREQRAIERRAER